MGGTRRSVAAHPPARTVTVDGLGLRVSDASRPGTVPLLLCNGIGGPIELWEPFRSALGDHPHIAFDAPGVGGSDVPVLPPTMAGLARTIIGLLDELGIEQVDALGVSWGGALAQQLGRNHPQRVRRLVLCATAAGGLVVPGRPRVMAALATPLRYWSPGYLNRVAPVVYGPDIDDDPEMLARQRHVRFTHAPSGRGYLYQMLALRRFVSGLWLHRIPQPTLVLHGGADPIVPVVNGRILAGRIPNARLEVVPGGGHLVVLTRAPAMADIVTAFLAA